MSSIIRDIETITTRTEADDDIRMNLVEVGHSVLAGRVDVLQTELESLRQETRLEIARSDEERDGRINERLVI